jgi:hypothetical protein
MFMSRIKINFKKIILGIRAIDFRIVSINILVLLLMIQFSKLSKDLVSVKSNKMRMGVVGIKPRAVKY